VVAAGIAILLQGAVCSLRAQEPSFDRDIQPILASKCLKCHGNDEAEAGLRLTNPNDAVAVLESGLQAVNPGNADESELLRRVASEDPAERMPPDGPPLTKEQIAKLRSWIAGGAAWPIHWAYRPLTRPNLPAANANQPVTGWPLTPVDQFILEKLSDAGLQPSEPASKRDLLRRVHYDLTGLPPTPEQIRAFEADSSPEAYERVVDTLLTSPRYGERWARHWMDVVHFAETHGHDQDRPRDHAWPYRDYLIRSFNIDKPYGRFVQEQLAGDVLFAGEPEAIVATGFLATGPWDESSLRDIREDTIDREIARYLDRDDIVTTVMSTFASSTVHCARCHDHKFDPISQYDYYALQAVFAATDKANRRYEPNAVIATLRNDLQKSLETLPQREKDGDPSLRYLTLQDESAAWVAKLGEVAPLWETAELVEFRSGAGAPFEKKDDGSLLLTGARPSKDVYTLVVRPTQKRVTAIRLEVLTDESLPKSGPGRQDNGNLHLNEFRVWGLGGADSKSDLEANFKKPTADFNQQGWSIEMALDGNPNTAWGIHPEVSKPHQAVFPLAEPLAGDNASSLRVELHQVHGEGHLIGRLRISTTDFTGDLSAHGQAITPVIAGILRIPRDQWTPEQQLQLAAAYLRQKWTAQLAALPPPQMVYCGTNQFDADGSFRPAAAPRKVHVLQRGDINMPLGEALPGALSCQPQLPATLHVADPQNEGQRRAALANWMVDKNNVLAWRSIANRVWHYHFGRGIVDTPNDFGKMGGVPSHPELLDWLAVELRDGDGCLKSLHRMIVTSAVYRQSSRHNPVFAAQDADNRLLWRMHRHRLDAESIRDSVLFIAGTLDQTMGGPSVKQFDQRPGAAVTSEIDYLKFDVDNPANIRRSVYRFIFRTLPDPFMDALDCPDASQLAPSRNTSLTALQSLAMLNDKVIVRHSEHLAARLKQVSPNLSDQIEQAFWMVFARPPTSEEAAAVEQYATTHGLANACRMLFNTNQFMFVE